MPKKILTELKSHAPFTALGAISGIVLILVFRRLPEADAFNIFYVLHPIHVVLSALVTSSMYELHQCGRFRQTRCNLLVLLAIGYAGSVGIATLSDSIIPYLGETLLGLPHREVHIGFIEKWWLVNPLALAGIAFAYFHPATKFPHSGHVLLSTWSSLFHILMAGVAALSFASYLVIFFFLFLSVWLPCCVSDIVFPLLFVKDRPGRDQ
jgi:hypothetical protein